MLRIVCGFGSVIIFVITMTGCAFNTAENSASSNSTSNDAGVAAVSDFTAPVAQVQFTNEARTQIDVYIADQPAEQSLGLGDIELLPSDQGMLFLFTNYDRYVYWMKGVEYPIDIIWLADNEIVDITERVEPEQVITPEKDYMYYEPVVPVNQVLEVQAGFVERNSIAIGQTISVLYYQ